MALTDGRGKSGYKAYDFTIKEILDIQENIQRKLNSFIFIAPINPTHKLSVSKSHDLSPIWTRVLRAYIYSLAPPA